MLEDRKTAVSCPERMSLLRWRRSQDAWWRVMEAPSGPSNPGNQNRCAWGPGGDTETCPCLTLALGVLGTRVRGSVRALALQISKSPPLRLLLG